MKASEIKEKMSKISKNDISSFFQKNWKYFTAVILFVVLAVVMIKFSSVNKIKIMDFLRNRVPNQRAFR